MFAAGSDFHCFCELLVWGGVCVGCFLQVGIRETQRDIIPLERNIVAQAKQVRCLLPAACCLLLPLRRPPLACCEPRTCSY